MIFSSAKHMTVVCAPWAIVDNQRPNPISKKIVAQIVLGIYCDITAVYSFPQLDLSYHAF